MCDIIYMVNKTNLTLVNISYQFLSPGNSTFHDFDNITPFKPILKPFTHNQPFIK